MIYVGLLRAVNLAGRRKVGMADLREVVERLGMEDVRTLLQSGNVVFRGARRSGDQLERLLEDALARRLGMATELFVRSAAEWKAVVAGNPFPAEARSDPGHLVVLFLKTAATAAAVEELRKAISGRERVQARGRELYAVYPDGIGRSKVTVALIEKKLLTRGTGRNWNTVLKLEAAASS